MILQEIEHELQPFFPECLVGAYLNEEGITVLIVPDEHKRTQAPVG